MAAVSQKVNCLLLDLNSYFASCEQQAQPRLRGKPVAVVPLLADTTSCIAASYEAKAFGVKTGTQVGEAKKMCPGLVLVEAHHELYVRYHHEILKAVESCWPIEKVLSIDEMSCVLTGSRQDLSLAIELSQKIRTAIQTQVGSELKCSIGIATNQFLAKVASDMQKPNGLTVILKEDIPKKLLSLKLQDMPGIGPRMEKRLNQQGIWTMEKLYACSKEKMRAVWGGVVGERFYYLLRGEEIVLPTSHSHSMSHQHVLPPNMRTPTLALSILQKLLIKGVTRLRKEKYFAKALSIQIKYLQPNGFYWEFQKKFQETQDTFFLINLLNQEGKKIPKGKPLRVTIVLSELVAGEAHQFNFFEDTNRYDLLDAIDNIQGKYGKEVLKFGVQQGFQDAAPVRIAFQRVPDLDEF